jgi:CDP-glucose 4,6-dehydratase
VQIHLDTDEHPHEAAMLTLDSTRAQRELDWRNRLDVATAVGWTLEWERAARTTGDARAVTERQIRDYWARGA